MSTRLVKFLATGPLTACLALSPFQAARAQQQDAPRAVRSEFSIAAGLAQANQFDATASPLRFDGRGFDVSAHYARASARYAFSASLDAGQRNLTSATSNSDIAERVGAGQFRLGVQRFVTQSESGTGLSLGAEVTTMLDITAHQYDDPTHSLAHFFIGSVTVGPAMTWSQSIAGGTARVRLAVPVAGFIDHPYSRTRDTNAPFDARFANVSSMRGASVGISYLPASNRRFGIEYAYRFDTFSYADVQPVRSLSQTFSIGAVMRFGSGLP
jgi:hypothetical protein